MVFVVHLFLLLLEIIVFKTVRRKKQIRDKSIDQIFLTLAFFQLVLLLALRSNSVGIDTPTYLGIFHAIGRGTKYYGELGFGLLLKIISKISTNSVFFLTIMAALTVGLNLWFAKKYSKDLYLSVFIYTNLQFYFFQFNLMRQALAVAIALLAVNYAIEKKWVPYFLLVAIAMSVHTSAIVALLVFPLAYFNIQFRFRVSTFALVLLMAGACWLLGEKLISFAVGTFLRGKYQGYLKLNVNENLYHPAMYLTILLIIVLLWRGEATQTDYLLFDFFVVGIALYFLTLTVRYANRLPYYFTIVITALLPNTIYRVSDQRIKVLATTGCYLCVGLYGLMMIAVGAQGILPYKFFWQ